jgi:hypothetical protein
MGLALDGCLLCSSRALPKPFDGPTFHPKGKRATAISKGPDQSDSGYQDL